MYNCTVSENDNYTVPSLFVLAAGCTRALLSSLTNRGTSSSGRDHDSLKSRSGEETSTGVVDVDLDAALERIIDAKIL